MRYEDLPKYKTMIRCPKCLHDVWRDEYSRTGRSIIEAETGFATFGLKLGDEGVEVISRTCVNCGYAALTRPMDAD
jgi:predicted nucleic-acid-binding Zn-ribbon protein